MSSNALLLLSLHNPSLPSYAHAFPPYPGGGTELPSSSVASGSAGLLEGAGGSLEGSVHDEIMFLPSDDDSFVALGLGDVKGGLDELTVSSGRRSDAAVHKEGTRGDLSGLNPLSGLQMPGSSSGHNPGAMSSSSSSSLGLMQQVVVYFSFLTLTISVSRHTVIRSILNTYLNTLLLTPSRAYSLLQLPNHAAMDSQVFAAMVQTMSNNNGMSIDQYLRRNLESVAPAAAAAAMAFAQGGGTLGGSLHRHTQHRR